MSAAALDLLQNDQNVQFINPSNVSHSALFLSCFWYTRRYVAFLKVLLHIELVQLRVDPSHDSRLLVVTHSLLKEVGLPL